MTRRNFFRSALACFGAMVLAPVRAVEPETVDLWEMYLPRKRMTCYLVWDGHRIRVPAKVAREWFGPSKYLDDLISPPV